MARAVLCVAVMMFLAVPAAGQALEQADGPAITDQAKTPDVLVAKVNVGPRPWWKKAARGLARGVTFGAVQAAADSVKQNTFFAVQADHDGVDTDVYEIYVNTQLRESKVAASLVNGTISFTFATGLPKGSYQLIIKARGEGGEGVSDPFSLSSTAGNPAAPRNVRVVKGGG